MSESKTPKNQTWATDRRLKNLFIAPSRQFKFASVAVAISLVTLFTFFGFELWLVTTLLKNVAGFIPPNSEVTQILSSSLDLSWVAFILVAIFFSVFVFLATIIVSHRLYGPIFAMRKHVAALTREEYGHRTFLRKNDEFKDLAKDLNDLSEKYESRALSGN